MWQLIQVESEQEANPIRSPNEVASFRRSKTPPNFSIRYWIGALSLNTGPIFLMYSLIGKRIPYSWCMDSQDSNSGDSVSRIYPLKSKTIPLLFIIKTLVDKLTDSEKVIYIFKI